MDVMQAILDRRSVRNFTGEPLSKEQITALLQAGVYAPSAMKRMPWHFVVLTDPAVLKRVPEYHPYAAFAPQAGCVIVVCADSKLNDNVTHLTQDTAAAIENMLLAAHGMGLGACWCGVYGNEERVSAMRKLCGIDDETILPMSLVVFGHPSQENPARPARMDETRFHYGKW